MFPSERSRMTQPGCPRATSCVPTAFLEERALAARRNLFASLGKLGSDHYGACLSEIEILTYLYFREMNVRPENPQWPDRDRFILSKGHGGFGLYAVLAERGFMPRERLAALEGGVMLPKHADKHRIHGSTITGIFDAALGVVAYVVAGGPITATPELSVSFLRCAPCGTDVSVKSSVVKDGRTLIRLRSEMTDASSGVLLATAFETFLIRDPASETEY